MLPVVVEPDVFVVDPLSDDDMEPVEVALTDEAEAGSAAIDPYAEQSGLGAEGQDSCSF
jgi:hypothetical protein